jgi:hypothetical protein
MARQGICAAASAILVLAAASTATGGDGWNALRRPLHLPVLPAGARCPVSAVNHRVSWIRAHIFGGSGIGPGPVYPGLGAADGLLWAVRDEQYGSKWYGQKVFWYITPSYRGRVLIRGRQLDGPGTVGFNGTRVPKSELRIEPYDTVSWHGQVKGSRGVPSSVRILTKGCYGFQVDGTTFSRTIVVTGDVAS